MENIRYNVVNNYKEMLQLKDMPEGAVVFNKANKKYYGHHENQWVELNCDFGKGGPQISLYDLNRDISPMDFLQLSGLDKLYCGSIIKEKYENGTICGSFVDQYMEILNGEKEPFRQELYAYLAILLMTEFDLIKR